MGFTGVISPFKAELPTLYRFFEPPRAPWSKMEPQSPPTGQAKLSSPDHFWLLPARAVI